MCWKQLEMILCIKRNILKYTRYKISLLFSFLKITLISLKDNSLKVIDNVS